MATLHCLAFLLLAGQLAAQPSRHTTPDGNPVIELAEVKIRDEARIPAPEAGVLTTLTVREGDQVDQDELLATIDDREAQAAVKVAKYAEAAALKRAEEDIEERYAKAASLVAKAEWEKVLQANQIKKGAVPETEVERAKLDYQRATLQIEKAGNDQILAAYDSKTKTAEREAAEVALDRRTIRAPFAGEVVDRYIHQSEWVSPGQKILRLVRFDTLYVEGRLSAMDFDRSQVLGKPVTIAVTKARGRTASLEGTIVHADQELIGKGLYKVRAEVKNEKADGSWLLQPGGNVRMTIRLNEAPQAAANPGLERRN